MQQGSSRQLEHGIHLPASVKMLVGSGDRIAQLIVPPAAVGVALNLVFPALFQVGGPPLPLRVVSWVLLVAGVVVWGWSVVLILTRVPRGELITTGPYAVVRHPLYTGVSLLVLPWLGLVLNTWLGVAIGLAMYLVARRCARAEESALAVRFGPAWERYRSSVAMPWL